MLTEKLFGVISLGCDKNRVDTEKLIGLIKDKGCRLTDDLSQAQIVIINTCAFLESARTEAIETILDCADYKNGKKAAAKTIIGLVMKESGGKANPKLATSIAEEILNRS